MCNNLLQSIVDAVNGCITEPAVDANDVVVHRWLEIPLVGKQKSLDMHVFVRRGGFLIELVNDGKYIFTHDVITGDSISLTADDVANVLGIELNSAEHLMKKATSFINLLGAPSQTSQAFAVVRGVARVQIEANKKFACSCVPDEFLQKTDCVYFQWSCDTSTSWSVLLHGGIGVPLLPWMSMLNKKEKIIKFLDKQPIKLYVLL